MLVHAAFHCRMAAETGDFTAQSVLQGAVDKLVRRHPHVFGDAQVESVQDVEEQWEALKRAERRGGSAWKALPAACPRWPTARPSPAAPPGPGSSGPTCRACSTSSARSSTSCRRRRPTPSASMSWATSSSPSPTSPAGSTSTPRAPCARPTSASPAASPTWSRPPATSNVAFETLSMEAKEALWQQAKAELG